MNPAWRKLFGWRDPLLVAGIVLLILGIRIFIGIRFVATMPQGDDTYTADWLQHWGQGIHQWNFILQRHNGHPMEMYYLVNLAQYLLNGYWDARLDFLVYAVIHAVYAWLIIVTFRALLAPRDRGWIAGLILFLFAVPFAGYRASWGLLWPDTAMMACNVAALRVAAYRGETWGGVVLALLLVALAAMNIAAGCLGSLALCGLVLFRAALARRCTAHDIVLAAGALAVFLFQYLTFDQTTKVGLLEGLNALLRALAWPVFFLPGIGLVTLVPMAGLVLMQIFSPAFRRKETTFLIGIGALIFLVALATGAFRGEANNGGMPSGRYTDIFVIVPLFCLVSLCLLYRAAEGRRRWGWGLFIYAWLCLQLIGFSVHLLFRVIPFISYESGEWVGGTSQALLRDVARTVPHPELSPSVLEHKTIFPTLVGQVEGTQPVEAMSLPMITGFPLQPGSRGDYVIDGYNPAYRPRPDQIYIGSYDLHKVPPSKSWFVSGSFRPTAPYLTFDFLVDKKARYSLYKLDHLEVTLVDVTTGQRDELLPKLSHQFPFFLRDWEMIYARVNPGDSYRIESYAQPVNWDQWIAFGEPFESGRWTPFIIGFGQSGKAISLLALGLLALAFGLRWLEIESRAVERA